MLRGKAEQRGKVDGRALLCLEQVGAAHELFHGARAQPRHDLAQLRGDEAHEALHVFRLADKALAQLWILRGDAEGTGAQMADAHHAAAHGDERRGGEAKFLRAQQQGDGDIVAAHQLAVRLQRHALAQVVAAQHLMRLGQPDLPRQARVVDAAHRRGPGAALAAGDEDAFGPSLGHAAGDGAHAAGGDELDGDARVLVGALQVVDQFRKVLDGVDVVVRRRGDEGDARRGAARSRHVLGDLGSGKVPALAGLGALRHLDLYLFGGEQVVARDAKAARGHLLDGGIAHRAKALGQFAALAAVGLAAQVVHGQRQTLVRLPRDGAVGHGPGFEALHDALHRLDFLQRHGLAALVAEGQQRAYGARAILLHHGGVAVKERAVVVPQRLLQRVDDLGAVEMFLRAMAGAQAVAADAGQRPAADGAQKGAVVMIAAVFLDAGQARAAQTVGRVGEIGVHQRRVQPHGFKQLRALVGLQGGNAHLRGDFEYAGGQRPVVTGDSLRGRFVDAPARAQRQHAFVRQIGVHRPRAKADEHGQLVNVARLAAFQQHGDGGALLFAHQVLLQRRHRQQRGDGQVFPVQPAVGEDDDVRALAAGAVAGGEHAFQSALQIPRPGIEQRDGAHAEVRVAQAADAFQFPGGEDGAVQFDDAAVLRRGGKKVAVVADVDALIGLDLFADGVDGRVRHLREALLEVRKQRRMRVGERRQRLVRAHGGGRLHAAHCHGQDRIFNILVRVAKGRAQARALLLAQRGGGGDGTGDVLKAQYTLRPFAVRGAGRQSAP